MEQSYATCATPLVYHSQPSPPPPSPMDFSNEFLMLQQGNHDTNERLEYYSNFIVKLLAELKTQKEAMCDSCRQKCTSSTTRSGNQSSATSTDSTIAKRLLSRVTSTVPQMPKMNASWRTRAPGSSSLPINKTMADSSSQLTKRRKESDNPVFSAERDALADTTLDVTLAHSFRHKNHVFCVCFSHDGRYMAVSAGIRGDASIFIYEVESHKKYSELREYATQYGSYTRRHAWNLCFSTNGRYLTAADVSGRIIIWDIPNKRIRSIFQGNRMPYEVRFSPDGRLVTFGTDAGLVVLNTRDNSRRMVSKGRRFDFSPHGRYIATGHKGVLMILDVRTGKAVKRWNGYGIGNDNLRRVKFISDGRGLLCVYSDMIEQWDLSDAVPDLIRKLDVKGDYFYHTSISPDHRILACANELWDVKRLKRQFTLKGHTIISSVDFSATGTYMAMGSLDGFVLLWKYNLS